MKTGERIPIYKVLTDGGFVNNHFTPGTLRPAKVSVLPMLLGNFGDFWNMYASEATLIGYMVIKTVK